MAKKDDDTQKLPAVGGFKAETPPEIVVKAFADKLEGLMNQAVHASVPSPNQQPTEYHQRFAHWANHLGDLWREVKQHVK